MINFSSPQGSVFIKPEEINVNFKKHCFNEINIIWYTCDNYRHYSMVGQFCELCGEIVSIPNFNTERIEDNEIDQPPCKTQNSIVTETFIPLTSGKMIISTGISHIIETPIMFQKDLIHSSKESKQGRINHLKIYERLGVLNVITAGNPKLYKKPDNSLIIASLSIEDRLTTDWEMIADDVNLSGSYSIMDYDDFIDNGHELEKLCKEFLNTKIIPIRKGVYRFTNYTEVKGFDPLSKDSIVFSNIEEIY